MPKKPYATIRDRMQIEIDNLERKVANLEYSLEIMETVIQDKKQIIAIQQQTNILLQEKYNDKNK